MLVLRRQRDVLHVPAVSTSMRITLICLHHLGLLVLSYVISTAAEREGERREVEREGGRERGGR